MYKPDEKQLVVKSNCLVEASYKLTIQEQRIILLMASMVKPEDEDFQIYRIKIKDFLDLVGIKDQGKYPEIKKITRTLRSRELIIHKPGSELQIGWLSSAEYFDGKGYVELEFSPKLKPYLLKLKEFFTSYQLKNVIQLKSVYSIRIYELLKQYEKIGKRDMELDELRYILGIEDKKYPMYANLKQKILNPAQKELEEKTDLSFKFEELKEGRKVKAIRFLISKNERIIKKEKEEKLMKLASSKTDNSELLARLQDAFCLSSLQADIILESFSTEAIVKKLAGIEKEINKGNIQNIGAYTYFAFKEDYNFEESTIEIKKEAAKKEKEEQEKAKKIREKMVIEYEIERTKRASELKQLIPKEKLEELEKKAKQKVEEKGKKSGPEFNFHFRNELEELLVDLIDFPPLERWLQLRDPALKKANPVEPAN